MFCRLSAIRRLPHLSAPSKRFTSSLKEGSVAQSKGFGEKERAQENQYAHQQEVREIEKLRAEEQLQAQHDELHKSRKD